MMEWTPINLEELPRKSQYLHFINGTGCDYSTTAEVDITALYRTAKKRGIKVNAAMVYAITAAANEQRELRMRLDEEGRLGYWDFLSPIYSIFHPEWETYSKIWTEFNWEFSQFYQSYLEDNQTYRDVNEYFGKQNVPKNAFYMTAIPWQDFASIQFHNPKARPSDLTPFLAWGRFRKKRGRVTVAMTLRVNHAVCDGFHVSRFFQAVEQRSRRAKEWLRQ